MNKESVDANKRVKHLQKAFSQEAFPCPSSPVFCQLPWLGAIKFHGEDAHDFLNRLLSNDLKNISDELSLYSGYCNNKGRLIAFGRVFLCESNYFFSMDTKLSEIVRKRLSMFVLRSRVNIEDATLKCAGLMGLGAEKAAIKIFGNAPANPGEQCCGENYVLIRADGKHCPRIEIYAKEADFAAIESKILEESSRGEEDLWRMYELINCRPLLRTDTSENFLPQSLNLDLLGAVSFTKGCFPGQEIIARIHYRGKPKQRLCLLRSSHEAMPPKTKVFVKEWHDEQPCGEIIDSCVDVRDRGWFGLAALRIPGMRHKTARLGAANGALLDLVQARCAGVTFPQ